MREDATRGTYFTNSCEGRHPRYTARVLRCFHLLLIPAPLVGNQSEILKVPRLTKNFVLLAQHLFPTLVHFSENVSQCVQALCASQNGVCKVDSQTHSQKAANRRLNVLFYCRSEASAFPESRHAAPPDTGMKKTI